MNEMKIIVEAVGKEFGEKRIFRNINFTVTTGQSMAIVGANGSGKTTLVRILCGLIRPTSGSVKYVSGNSTVENEKIFRYIGLVGPYLELYEELTALENMRFFARMRGMANADPRIFDLLNRVGLKGRQNDSVKTYSSGMRQRLKYVFALLAQPPVLILDEPTSNLDAEGTKTVYTIMQEQKKNGILILATNDEEDLNYGDFQVAVAS